MSGAWEHSIYSYGANHNHFNSVWRQDDGPTISRADQENVAKVYFSALAQGALLHRGQYLNVLKDVGVAQRFGWIPASITLVSQHQDYQRIPAIIRDSMYFDEIQLSH